MKKKLEALLVELTDIEEISQQSAEIVSLDQTRVGRLSRMDAMQAQAISIEANRRRALHVQLIQAALARIESGDYGWCLECGEAINPKRLEVDPAVSLCIDCANQTDT